MTAIVSVTEVGEQTSYTVDGTVGKGEGEGDMVIQGSRRLGICYPVTRYVSL